MMRMIAVLWLASACSSNDGLQAVPLQSKVTSVQPMTGIVLWEDNDSVVKSEPGVVQLEYAYVKPSDISTGPGVYDWSRFDDFLDRIAGRGHQAVARFYDTYPGEATAVPAWIKASDGYQETSATSEGLATDFPDWRSLVLQQFYVDFYSALAARYDNDARLAFLQVGFGLWGEYHIYDGPNVIGEQFPSHDYQQTFLRHLDEVFTTLRWSISIDSGDSYYGPFEDNASLLELDFGLFDDSFMVEEHDGYNASMWQALGHQHRLRSAPAGGELSYASDFDQQHALDVAGMYGRSYEQLSARYGISYMIGNDQPQHQSAARIREAGLANGYRFAITRFVANGKRSEVTVANTGTAPLYYDAYVAVDGVRGASSLRGLMPGEDISVSIAAAGQLTIECDRLVAGQQIGFDADL
jgi:hypothetical protein